MVTVEAPVAEEVTSAEAAVVATEVVAVGATSAVVAVVGTSGAVVAAATFGVAAVVTSAEGVAATSVGAVVGGEVAVAAILRAKARSFGRLPPRPLWISG